MEIKRASIDKLPDLVKASLNPPAPTKREFEQSILDIMRAFIDASERGMMRPIAYNVEHPTIDVLMMSGEKMIIPAGEVILTVRFNKQK